MRILWERSSKLTLHRITVVGDDPLPVFCRERRVDRDVEAILVFVEDIFEHVVIKVQHHIGIHLDEASIAVEGKTAVASQLGQSLHGSVVQAQIKHRIHHAWHRGARAGANRHQQRICRVTKGLACDLFDLSQPRLNLTPQLGRIGLGIGEIIDAGFGGDCESWGHRQAQGGHLSEIGPLPAKEVLHRRVAIGDTAAKGIDPARLCQRVGSHSAYSLAGHLTKVGDAAHGVTNLDQQFQAIITLRGYF